MIAALIRSGVGLFLTLGLAGAGVATAGSGPSGTPEDVAQAFMPRVERVIGELAVDPERLSVRANRCSDTERDDVFYIWIGLRARAPAGDAGAQLRNLHGAWKKKGWEVTRYRLLDNGGVNIAARDPETGDSHALDSGFRTGPEHDIVGFFNTPCFRNPDGTTAFGHMFDRAPG